MAPLKIWREIAEVHVQIVSHMRSFVGLGSLHSQLTFMGLLDKLMKMYLIVCCFILPPTVGCCIAGAAQCLGSLYQAFGARITSGLLETSNIVMKLMKSSEVIGIFPENCSFPIWLQL